MLVIAGDVWFYRQVLEVDYSEWVTAACLVGGGDRIIGVETDPVQGVTLSDDRPPVGEPGVDSLVAVAYPRMLWG